jgi:replicative DNA helicase
MLDFERIKQSADIRAVIGRYVQLKKSGTLHWTGLCPFHREQSPSFTVTPGKQIWKCFGCEEGGDVIDFVRKIEHLPDNGKAGERVAELVGVPDALARPVQQTASTSASVGKMVAAYRYDDENGQRLYEICRIEPGKGGKKKEFLQRFEDAETGELVFKKHPRQVLYRLPKVLAADTVWLVEGEKDADTLDRLGLVATTNAGGTGAPWLPEFSESLRGKKVFIIPDNDEAGKKCAAIRARSLQGVAAQVLTITLPVAEKGDVTDFIQTGNSVDDLKELAEDALRIARRDEISAKGFLTPAEIIENFDGGYSAFLDASRRPKGLPTGFSAIDSITLGMHQGELVILAARPSMGKTALALNIAANAARAGKTVAFFSLEMSRESLLMRLTCAEARVDLQRFRLGFLDRAERERLQEALSNIAEWSLVIDYSPMLTMQTATDRLKKLRKSRRFELVVVDYLQLMTGTNKNQQRVLEVGEFSRGFKILAGEFGVPFLVLSQLSRAPETRGGRPLMSDLRDSGSIEQDADQVWFVYREEVYKPNDASLTGLAELIVSKQRNGPTLIGKLVYLPKFTRFEDRAV